MTEETQYTPKTVKDVDAHEFVRQYAKHLKGKVSDRTIHDEGSGTGRGCTERARAVLPLAVAGASIGAFRSPCALALAPSPLASARPCRDRRPRERKERLSDKKINSFLSLSLSLSLQLTPCENVDLIKTGCYKELSPYDPDWYYVRAASVARKIYLKQGIGIGKFRKIYGSTYRKGVRTEHFCKVSGGVIRHICQQLEKAGLVELYSKGGRVITSAGKRDLDLIAGRCPNAPKMIFT